MWLCTALQSMWPCACASGERNVTASATNPRNQRIFNLLVTQRLHWIEPGGARSWIQSGKQANDDGEYDRASDQPPRNEPDLLRCHALLLEINVRAHVDDAPERPAQRHTQHSAHQAHHTGFGKEQLLYVNVAGA